MHRMAGHAFMFIAFSFFLASGGLYAEITLPFLIADGAVIQRRVPIPIWGRCEADAEVDIAFAGKSASVRSDGDGAWRAVFGAEEAGGPYQLRVRCGEESKTIRDILVGDVWVCSGQSNMEWILLNTENAPEEIAASENSHIRHFYVPHTWSAAPSDRLAGGNWASAGPDTTGDFTAVGYYFAKMVQAETGIPVGLLHSSWGGSNIESWMSPAALGETEAAALERMQQLVDRAELQAQTVKNRLNRWPDALASGLIKAESDWSPSGIDENDWLEISAPQLWEAQGFEGVDGVVWYRKTIILNEEQASSGIVLSLARIDDNDVTWVNGHKVGETNAYDQVRRYRVPPEFLKAGENGIAVRIEDTGGGGGIYSDPDLLYAEPAGGDRISLAGVWKFKADKVTVSPMTDVNHTPTALYNKMMHPLFQFPVKGILWYQGESNADNVEEAVQYGGQFKNLIEDWRKSWHMEDLPFYWVQLANFKTNLDTEEFSPWAIVREAQTAALELPNTGQAITIDVGNPDDIHPRDKKTVGTRLALIALSKTYEKSNVSYAAPVLDTCDSDGGTLTLNFKGSEAALTTTGEDSRVSGFEIAGENRKFMPATAWIRGDTVYVSNPSVKKPVGVRYAWKDNPEEADLAGTNGLPVGPFRILLEK